MPKKEAEALAMHYLERVRIAEHANKFPGRYQVDSSSVWLSPVHCV
jgi:ABC-type histidine transport system ATPase subunit